MPEHIFTGLRTKAGFSVTSSATFNKTVSEFGTIEDVRELISGRNQFEEVITRDLSTGEINGAIDWDGDLGEYIFWKALDVCLTTDPRELSKIMLSSIQEPGKTRIVTKGYVALKIILDVVAHIASFPLTKVESSASGMSKGAHAWELYKKIASSEELADTVEQVDDEGETEAGRTIELTRKTLFCSCTDYETATDYVSHRKAKHIMGRWMTRCGIPRLLKHIVVNTAYNARDVYFTGEGPLKIHGEQVGGTNLRRVTLIRGVMMGDPLTKVLLHLINITARQLGNLTESDLEPFFTNASSVYKELYG
jgi:hypothetical protein